MTEKKQLAYKIQNVVATYKAGVERLNLRTVSMLIPWGQINNEVFAAWIARLSDPKTTILAFTSGNNVCTGAKSEIDSRIACRMMADIMQRNLIECSVNSFTVQNIVASASTGFPLKLEEIATRYCPDASYEPEIFPGLIYRMPDLGIVFLVFREGKLVITGGKVRRTLTKAINFFYENILLPHRDTSDTINYIQTPSDPFLSLAKIVETIVEEFSEKKEVSDMLTHEDERPEDMSDLGEMEKSLTLFDERFKQQYLKL